MLAEIAAAPSDFNSYQDKAMNENLKLDDDEILNNTQSSSTVLSDQQSPRELNATHKVPKVIFRIKTRQRESNETYYHRRKAALAKRASKRRKRSKVSKNSGSSRPPHSSSAGIIQTPMSNVFCNTSFTSEEEIRSRRFGYCMRQTVLSNRGFQRLQCRRLDPETALRRKRAAMRYVSCDTALENDSMDTPLSPFEGGDIILKTLLASMEFLLPTCNTYDRQCGLILPQAVSQVKHLRHDQNISRRRKFELPIPEANVCRDQCEQSYRHNSAEQPHRNRVRFLDEQPEEYQQQHHVGEQQQQQQQQQQQLPQQQLPPPPPQQQQQQLLQQHLQQQNEDETQQEQQQSHSSRMLTVDGLMASFGSIIENEFNRPEASGDTMAQADPSEDTMPSIDPSQSGKILTVSGMIRSFGSIIDSEYESEISPQEHPSQISQEMTSNSHALPREPVLSQVDTSDESTRKNTIKGNIDPPISKENADQQRKSLGNMDDNAKEKFFAAALDPFQVFKSQGHTWSLFDNSSSEDSSNTSSPVRNPANVPQSNHAAADKIDYGNEIQDLSLENTETEIKGEKLVAQFLDESFTSRVEMNEDEIDQALISLLDEMNREN